MPLIAYGFILSLLQRGYSVIYSRHQTGWLLFHRRFGKCVCVCVCLATALGRLFCSVVIFGLVYGY